MAHQVESFIPLWEWDEKKPKKKAKEKGKEKAKGKGKERAKSSGASHDSAYIEEVEDPGDSNPLRRAPRIQEVQDEDA